jgi:hypothetical protein
MQLARLDRPRQPRQPLVARFNLRHLPAQQWDWLLLLAGFRVPNLCPLPLHRPGFHPRATIPFLHVPSGRTNLLYRRQILIHTLHQLHRLRPHYLSTW